MVSAKKPRKAEAKTTTKANATATAPGPRKKKNHDQPLLQPPRSSRTRAAKTDVHDDITNANATTSKSADGSSCDPDHELRQVQALLGQIWHRNKNQHQGQKWWKWVSVLKRRVRDLVELAVDGTGDGTRSGGKVKPGTEEEGGVSEAVQARKRLERRRVREEKRRQVEEWVREVVLGRCWLAFSTLVADPQFSPLGVVLLAILARVGRLVGLPTKPPLPATAEPEPAAQQQRNTLPLPLLATSLAQTDVDVDRGEVVERASDGSGQQPKGSRRTVERRRQESSAPEARVTRAREAGEGGTPKIETREDDLGKDDGAENEMGSRLPSAGDSEKTESKLEAVAYRGSSLVGRKESAMAERKKKRRKKGNAIDELFAGLS